MLLVGNRKKKKRPSTIRRKEVFRFVSKDATSREKKRKKRRFTIRRKEVFRFDRKDATSREKKRKKRRSTIRRKEVFRFEDVLNKPVKECSDHLARDVKLEGAPEQEDEKGVSVQNQLDGISLQMQSSRMY